jgi:DNA-binding SARP family transcriptional activator
VSLWPPYQATSVREKHDRIHDDGIRRRLARSAPGVLRGAKQNGVLTTLLWAPNSVVSKRQIINLVWREADQPYTAVNLVESYISRLRCAFRRADVTDVNLVARPGGYLIEIDPDHIDWHVFNRLVGQARWASREDDLVRTKVRYREALRLWRGPALADLPAASLDDYRTNMENRLLSAVGELADVELRLGETCDAVERLQEILAQHPEHEQLTVLLMRAYHALGRKSQAVRVYRRIGQLLARQYDIHDSPELVAAYREILRGPPYYPILPGNRVSDYKE